jgi:hypothetical protein
LHTHINSASPSLPSTWEKDNVFRSLSASLEANRKRVEDIINTLPPPEFYDAIADMRADITSLYFKADNAERSCTTSLVTTSAHASVAPSLFMQAPLGAAKMLLPNNAPPTAPNASVPHSLFHAAPPVPCALFAPTGGLDSSTLGPLKCLAPVFGGVASKRPRFKAPQNPWPDVLFGPVTIMASTKPTLKALTSAAIRYLMQLAGNAGQYCTLGEEDIASTQINRSGPNTLSIRFKSCEKASLFCPLVEHYSPLPGQAAVFRADAGTQLGRSAAGTAGAGVAENRALYDLFGGNTNTSSER